MDIPVFHDDQHGTAVICAAGLLNALHLSSKRLEDVRIVLNGAGAAGIACVELLKSMGARHENCIVCDTKGVIYQGRTEGMNQWKSAHAVKTDLRTLEEAMDRSRCVPRRERQGRGDGRRWLGSMAENPVIFAMANPDPEITPEEAHEVRRDAIVATGRSRLSQPGQQRARLSLSLPRRARHSCPRDQRRDEDRLRRRAGGAGARGCARRGGVGLRPQAELRARLHHPDAVRSAPDLAHSAGRGAGGHGHRRRPSPDHRHGGLRAGAEGADGSDRLHPAGAERARKGGAGPDDLCRGR